MRVWRPLFGVSEPGEEPLEGEAFRSAIMDLVPRSTRHFGADPRLVVFEDLHWCDDASMDLLIETARVVDDQPSLMVFAFRPDPDAPSWRLKRWLETEYPHRSIQISLTPLSEEDSGALIDELLPEGSRSDAVRAGILERTEGNPLFLEELAAAIQVEGSNDTVPATLQASITARLDTLDDHARRLDANADAVTHCGTAIDAARRLGAAGELLTHLYPNRGRALELSGRYDEAEENYEEMRANAEASGDRAAELQADMSLTTL